MFQPRWGYGVVPSQIIFLDQRRYHEDGSRWIPKSFLSQASPSSSSMRTSQAGEFGQTFSTGIKVDYPGIFLSLPHSSFQLPQDFIVEISGVDYRARIHEAGSEDYRSARTVYHPSIILQSLIDRRPSRSTGVLVEVKNWEEMRSRLSRKQVNEGSDIPVKKALRERLRLGDTWQGIVARHEGLVDLDLLRINEFLNLPRIRAERIELIVPVQILKEVRT